MRKVSSRAALALATALLTNAAQANDYRVNQNQTGLNLPTPGTSSGFDEVRAADGTSCRSAVGNGGAYMDMGAIGNQRDGALDGGALYGRVVVPLGKRPDRVDCNRLYSLEVERLKMEVKALRAGLAGVGGSPSGAAEPFPTSDEVPVGPGAATGVAGARVGGGEDAGKPVVRTSPAATTDAPPPGFEGLASAYAPTARDALSLHGAGTSRTALEGEGARDPGDTAHALLPASVPVPARLLPSSQGGPLELTDANADGKPFDDELVAASAGEANVPPHEADPMHALEPLEGDAPLESYSPSSAPSALPTLLSWPDPAIR